MSSVIGGLPGAARRPPNRMKLGLACHVELFVQRLSNMKATEGNLTVSLLSSGPAIGGAHIYRDRLDTSALCFRERQVDRNADKEI